MIWLPDGEIISTVLSAISKSWQMMTERWTYFATAYTVIHCAKHTIEMEIFRQDVTDVLFGCFVRNNCCSSGWCHCWKMCWIH